MATSFTTHSAGQVIASADINLIQTAVNTLEGLSVRQTHLVVSSQLNASSSSNAFKGCLFTPTVNMTIQGLYVPGILTTAATYAGKVCTLASNSPGSTTISTVVGSSDSITVGAVAAGATALLPLPFSTPVSLVAGTTYALLVGTTSGTGTTVLPMWAQAATGASDILPAVNGVVGAILVCASAAPVASTAVTVSAASTTVGRLVPGITVTTP